MEEETANATASIATSTASTNQPLLPAGLSMPKPLKTDGNLANNWKRFKRTWDNYAIISRLNRFDDEFKTATFLSCVGEDAMEIYEGMDFATEEDRTKLDIVVNKFQELCLGETNETYERFIFNNRQKKETETIDQYVTAVRTLTQTCNFCACLRDSLIRDRLVLGINDNTTQKKLLQDRKLTLARAIDICRSSESSKTQIKKLKENTEDAINAFKAKQTPENREPALQCRYCGGNHPRKKELCPAFGRICKNCGRTNHFAKACLQKRKTATRKPLHNVNEDDSSDSGDSVSTVELTPTENILTIQDSANCQSRLFTTMKIKGGKETKFQIDTGATCNVIRKSELKGTKYERNIKPTTQLLKMFNNTALTPIGKCRVQLQDPHTKKKFKVPFTVVSDEHAKSNLLGCRTVQRMQLIRAMNQNNTALYVNKADEIDTGNNTPSEIGLTLQDIQDNYSDVFEGLGVLGPDLHLEIEPASSPVQLPPRKIPESLKQPLRIHLDELVKLGVVERVEYPTDWVSAIVVTRKPNGKIRLCLDPRPLNKVLKRCHHPMPTIEDVLPELANAKVFSKVDCSNGYWQVKLDEESSQLTTFNTPFGRFKWKRMPFGISPAGEVFQQRLDQAIDGLDGVRTVADDILITGNGATMEDAIQDHDKKLKKLFECCRAKQIKLNRDKIELKKTSMPYIGHILTSNGVKADPSKIKAILQMKQPEDVAGVRRVLGMVNYLAKFLPRLSQVSEPLRQLTKKEQPFVWNTTHDQAFIELKKLITQPPILKYYEPDKPLVLQCDASDYGLGAALIQEGKPIAFASRALTNAEKNYAQIEKELLAIAYGTNRFHQYTYGRPVLVESDHKPLEVIHQKPLSAAPRRLQKMMMQLQNYDITIQYKKGSEMYLADTLSRHNLENSTCDMEEACESRFPTLSDSMETDRLEDINQLITSEATLIKFQEETVNDSDLQAVKSLIQSGWPENPKGLNPVIMPFFHIRDELATQEGLIFRGDRLVIPKSLRKQMLSELHSAHQGIESTTRRARETIYWPHLNQELKDYISRCETCATYNHKQPKQPLISHDVPERAWAKVGSDLFELDKKTYLVTVDYFSNFFEIDCLDQRLTATDVIGKLKSHFARYGIPDTMVTDNGPQFASAEFQEFGKSYRFEHVRTSPYHHQSNGKAEAAVKQAKKLLQKCQASKDDPHLALLVVRNTPQETHGTSPAQRMFNRRTKTRLPTPEKLMKPKLNRDAAKQIKKAQEQQRKYYNRGARELSPLKEGDKVRIQPTRCGQKKWKKGRVVKQVGIRSYQVESNGYTYTRNRRFLRKSTQDEPNDEYSDDDGNEAIEEEPPAASANNNEAETIAQPIAPGDTNIAGTSEADNQTTKTRSGRAIKKPTRLGFET